MVLGDTHDALNVKRGVPYAHPAVFTPGHDPTARYRSVQDYRGIIDVTETAKPIKTITIPAAGMR